MPKPKPASDLPGIWQELTDRFPELPAMAGCTREEIVRWAKAKTYPPVSIGAYLSDLCAVHGVQPRIYVYSMWDRHRNIAIASLPQGWGIASLEASPDRIEWARWEHDPAKELKPAPDDLVRQVRSKRWDVFTGRICGSE
jgi:hypothetical protein